ncbi:SpaA isopeptide-forming pilin-related protein [Oscillospiraceae bacterium 44-5]
MKKRMISLLLVLVTLLGILPVTSFAAPTLEEAMAEVDVYARNETLDWLTMNGSVKEQHYTYYKYESVQTGQVKVIPAYCVDPRLYGVPALVPEGTPIKYTAPDTVSDPKVCGIIANGYPHEPLSVLKVNTPEEAYYATKTALWIYLLGNWSVNGLGINPKADQAAAKRVLEATRTIYNRGMGWSSIPTPKLTATADKDVAYPVTINGQPYYQQVITISSDTWSIEDVKVNLAEGAPAGAKILDMNDQEITRVPMSTFSMTDGHKGQCKIVYPASGVEGQTGTVQLNMRSVVVQYEIYYAKSLQADQYGNIQDYMLDTDPHLPVEASFISRYSAEPDVPDEPDSPPPSSETAIKVIKLETGTLTPLEGAVFKLTGPDGTTVGSFSTQRDGTFTIPVTQTGHYTVEELSPPKWHLISDDATQHVQAVHGETAEVTFYNDPYGNLRVEKYSDTGEPLKGVTIQIKHIATGETRSAQTGPGGAAEFTELKPGGWEVKEIAGIEGWIADTDTVQTVSVAAGETSTVTFTNKELPGLRIIKYDRTTLKVMTDIPFEIWRDSESLGQYSTNQQGEILITNAQPGTYLVKEVQSDDEHVTDATPQQIELHAGDGIKDLVFFNGRKPGIHLVKVDRANLSKPIPNVKFSIRAVDGTFGPKEFTTNEDGEIDLSKLSPGAYEVLELECPGYVIDQAQRIIQLEADQNAEFVFTNSKLPSLYLMKTSSDGSPLAGVSFRLAKIEDGSHYLDRTTNAQGEILWEGLEPGVYSLKETATVADHILDIREYHVELFPGKTSEIVLENQKRPNLIVYKHDADTGEPVPNTVFLVKAADGHSVDEIKTDGQGKATLSNLLPGVYEVSEKSVPAPWLMDAPSQLVTLYPNRDHTVYFENHKKPTLTVNKVDSITGSPIKGAKFEVWYGSNSTTTGELNSLGTFFSDENGQFSLDLLRDGWYKVTELAPAAGYTIKEPATQEFYIKGGESKVITFENVPKNAIIVEKYDSVTGAALPGCTFQLRYLGGTSGTGGTVIGTKVTGKNGTAMWTGLNPGAYVLEEVDAADGYNIIQSSETIMLADSGEQSVVTVRFTNAPDGQLLIRKVCSVNPSVTLQNAEFKVLYADGTVVGDSNGVYRTDENGEIRITGLTPGKSVVVTETRAPAGFILDTQSQTVQIKEGRTVSLTFKNQPRGAIIIQKRDSATGLPLSGAEFRVTTAAGCEVGLDGVIGTSTLTQNGIFTTDAQGEIKITNLAPGAYVLNEIKAPTGYVMDSASTNVVIGQGGDTQTVIVTNSKAGTLVIDKRDALTGKPLKGVTFKVTTSTGEFVPAENGQISSNGLYFTDKDGKITINGVVGTLVVTETATIPGYTIDEATRTQTVVVNPNDTQTLHFTNTPSTTLVIEKYIEGTTTPLKGVTFLITDSSGAVVGNSNGEFITDENGRIVLNDLTPGTTVTAREVKTLEGYVLDGQPKSILIKSGEVQTLRFYNAKQGTIVVKKLDKQTGEPLAGVEFQITYSDGSYLDDDYGHLSSKGLYKTDANGEIRISGVVGTLIITETKPLPGYVMDEGTKTQTVKVNPTDTQTITVYNTKVGGLTIIKTDEETGERISGVQFEIRKLNGGIVGTYTTDRSGVISLPEAEKGWYQVTELKAAKGYQLDSQPYQIEVKDGGTATLEITNRQAGSAIIHKVDSLTGEAIYGVKFLVSDAKGNPIGTYESDNEGYVYIDKDLADGKYTVRELECAQGYILDTVPKTFCVEYGGCTTITWPNTAVRGQIQIVKKSAEYNSVNGLPAGTLLEGATFEIYNERNGNKVDTIVTGANGLASSKQLPLGRYTIRETKAPANYGVSTESYTAVLEYSGQIVRLEITNKSLSTGVSIEKTGPKEAMSGQPVRYVFSRIGNTSNVMLQSFYWCDTLPAAVRLDKVVTGTYNFPGTYKIVYRVNNTGDYRTLADSLSTSRNYTFAASPAALGLASNERVTEVMFVFGQVPGGFAQVEAPMLYCTAVPGLAPGSSFANVADVGGTYNGVWVQGVTRWVTTVYGKPTPLPRTGY